MMQVKETVRMAIKQKTVINIIDLTIHIFCCELVMLVTSLCSSGLPKSKHTYYNHSVCGMFKSTDEP